MLLSEFDYELPKELIAQQPLAKRDASRMLVLKRSDGSFKDELFSSFPKYLREGDVLVLNNTKVFPARLYGKSETGARVEVFLVEELEQDTWTALARPGKRLKTGKRVEFGDELSAEVTGRDDSGLFLFRFECEGSLESVVDKLGSTPLPPYIKRSPAEPDEDRERYQTLYAKERGAIAAPTAGLHFTRDLLDQIGKRGIEVVEITLHVGYATFEPVRVEDLTRHRVSAERFDIPRDSAERLTNAKSEGRRIVAVGTTTTRALESAIGRDKTFTSGSRTADLTIVPGFEFQAVDCLLTNFHLPKSSLLLLVSAFAGHEAVMRAYRHAVGEKYRFYSYGDCMFIV